MSSTLGLANLSSERIDSLTPEQRSAAAARVKRLGIIALVLLLTAFLPIIGLFGAIISLVLSRMALRISRQNLVSVEHERAAYWASVISSILLILYAIGLVLLLLNS